MKSLPSRKLSIVIPTYNRAEFLDFSLSVHVPLAREHGVEIFVSDNFSSDNTTAVVERWMQEYPNLYYSCNDRHVDAEKNFEVALGLPNSQYVWLLGDTYQIPSNGISYLLRVLDTEDYAAVVVNLNSKIRTSARCYQRCDDLLAELAGIMSCLSCLVLSRALISRSAFSRYHGSYFVHAGIALEYIASSNRPVYWAGDLSVTGLSSERLSKRNWSNTPAVIDVGVEKWVNFIFSLPPSYSLNSKLRAAQGFSLLSWRGIGLMHADGLITRESFSRYRDALRLAVDSRYKYIALAVLSWVPAFLMGVAVGVVRGRRGRKNG